MTALATLVKHYATPLPPDAEGRWYLASPYTSEDPAQTETWVQEMRDLIPRFINAYPKIVPLVPVVYTDPLAEHCEPTGGWYAFGLSLLDTAQGFIVVTQDGWEHSRGIMLELGFARAKGIPIATFDPNCVTAEVEITVDDDSEVEHGLAESDILDQMEKMRSLHEGYENWSEEKLREKAIDILEDEIPF